MTRLYVANCTRQFQEIHFRLDFASNENPMGRVPPAKRQTIPPGRQVPLGGDLHMTQVDDIVSQLKPYGLIGVADIGRVKGFTPYVFNVDKPVTPAQMRDVIQSNAEVKLKDGKDLRQMAAVASNEAVAHTVANEFAEKGIAADPNAEVEIEFEQLEDSNPEDIPTGVRAAGKRVEEGYKIDAKSGSGRGKSGKRK